MPADDPGTPAQARDLPLDAHVHTNLSPDADVAFSYGYGFGYNVSPAFASDVMIQDHSTALHQRTGLSAGESTSNGSTTTRIVARFGLGGR